MTKPFVLSVAGLDPSGGAGLLSDVKTMAAFGTQGLGVCTAVTLQNGAEFRGVEWVEHGTVLAQIEPLLDHYPLAAIKVGLVESIELLCDVIAIARARNADLPIVWDPVFAPSSGGTFREPWTAAELYRACEGLTLITPNRDEIAAAFPTSKPDSAAERLSVEGAVLLKGGHGTGPAIVDQLFVRGVLKESFAGPRLENDKRGTGCVTSTAIAAGLALGHGLGTATGNAIRYVRSYIKSGPGRFGTHQPWELVSTGVE
ncbi:MAG: hydroxymethylpyrimidine/phosphomethylpyrimidine kinase [Acidobacteria bacterium]|nr:hydroxymethylpyrimidine/phosphomethylpyrimidine kinase [Acidobacteriota bacterium]